MVGYLLLAVAAAGFVTRSVFPAFSHRPGRIRGPLGFRILRQRHSAHHVLDCPENSCTCVVQGEVLALPGRIEFARLPVPSKHSILLSMFPSAARAVKTSPLDSPETLVGVNYCGVRT